MRRNPSRSRAGATTSTTMALAAGGLLLAAIGFSLGLLAGRGMAESGEDQGGSNPVVVAGAGGSGAPVATAPDGTTPPVPSLDTPPIELYPPELDFGELGPGAPVTGSVEIRNLGTKPLRILQSRASCKCTAVNLANSVIPPGESLPMVASLDPGYALGPKKASVRLLFEGYTDVVEVPITAQITMAVRATPPYINATDPGLTSGTLTIESTDGRPFNILAFHGEAPTFANYVPGRDEPRARYELAWDLSAYDRDACTDAEGNRMPVYMPIETDHPDCGVLDVQVRHNCTRRIPPSPPQNWALSERRILIGALEEGESYEFTVHMIWLRRQPPSDVIQSVETDSDQFTVELLGTRRTPEDVFVTVRVTPAPGHRGLIYDTLRMNGTEYSEPLLIVGRVLD